MLLKRLYIAASLALIAANASASCISIQSEPSLFIENGEVVAVISLTNLGDETAYDLAMQASCTSQRGMSEAIQELAPAASATMKAALGPSPQPDGIYTVVFKIFYHDSGGHSYSALNSIALATDIDLPPKHLIQVSASSVELGQKGSIEAAVTPLASLDNVTLSLFLPDEISCRKESQVFAATEGLTTGVSFTIRNRNANQGSTYLALLVCDYIYEGVHISRATPLSIRVSSTGTPAKPPALLMLLIILTAAGFAIQLKPIRKKLNVSASFLHYAGIAAVTLSLIAIELFLLYNLQPKYLLMNTTTVGGDTPAHNYIASHLRDSLFGHGRLVSWGGGWWCGFPMFQFYFSLPYIAMVLLDLVLPFNISFKLVAITGILALPVAAWYAGRLLRLPKPAPAVIALFMIPVLFDHSHTMWGVNIYSTLAGMISNSLSFPIMLIFLASAWRDSEDQKFRIRTVLLLALVLASHFFTSIIGLITAAIIPFLRHPRHMTKALLILSAEVLLAMLLMCWWIIPLLFKLQYTADFGLNWDVKFFGQLPMFTKILSPLLIPLAVGVVSRKERSLIVVFWMLICSLLLFFFGFGISNVFVNVRLWPFIVCSLVLLEGAGFGYLLSLLPASRALTVPLALSVVMFAVDAPNQVPQWAKWNFEGLESKQYYSVFEKLVLPLRGTPGRLANDLCDENNIAMGSSRIFELAPHLAGKPILEGGIVNSAAGSMFSYYIQGETSQNCAGFPSNVKPTTFNIANATRHLELFNVKHFIAHWETTRNAMRNHKDWRFIGREQQWELYELMSHDASYVFAPPFSPMAVETRRGVMDWKSAGLEWIYNIASIDNHFVILPEHGAPPVGMPVIPASRYLDIMKAKSKTLIYDLKPEKLPKTEITVKTYTDYAIEFETTQPGVPHIIKSTWYPNWKALTGEHIYMVTPCFMMVIPKGNTVRITYGRTGSDITGIALSTFGLMLLLALVSRSLLNRRRSA